MSEDIGQKIQYNHLGFKVTMYNAVMAHQSERHQHLARETTDESSRKPDEAIRFDEFV
jgi:hypothetical protein